MPGRRSPPMPESVGQWASSALTRVPASLPGAGCVTSPAGLLMTSRSSSSNRIGRSIASGTSVLSVGGGSSQETTSAERTDSLGLAARRLSRTCPSRMSACTRARERCASAPARNRSRRLPASVGGTVSSDMAAGWRTRVSTARRGRTGGRVPRVISGIAAAKAESGPPPASRRILPDLKANAAPVDVSTCPPRRIRRQGRGVHKFSG